MKTVGEPVAWLRHGEKVPLKGCPFGAMWISDKDDPRSFPVYAVQPPPSQLQTLTAPVGYATKNELTKLRLGASCVDLFGQVVPVGFEMVPLYAHPPATIFPSDDEIRRLAELALEEMREKATTDREAWIASYEKVIMSYRRLALAKQQLADRDPETNVMARIAELEAALAAEEDRNKALLARLDKAREGKEPDFCYDPEEWEFTCDWDERDEVHGHGEALRLDKVMQVATLIRGPRKWVAEVPTSWTEDGDPEDTEIRWFDTEEAARAALAAPATEAQP